MNSKRSKNFNSTNLKKLFQLLLPAREQQSTLALLWSNYILANLPEARISWEAPTL
jgi:hypothetical protein